MNPRKEDCKGITLRSGKEMEGPTMEETPRPKSILKPTNYPIPINRNYTSAVETEESDDEDEKMDEEIVVEERPVEKKGEKESLKKESEKNLIQVPFPQRLIKKKEDKSFSSFIDLLKQLTINIPFMEALLSIPTYTKHMKQLLNKKKKGDMEDELIKGMVNSILDKNLPCKMSDPGAFNIPCVIKTKFVGNALCDLGASVNVMPLSMFERLKLGEVKESMVKLQMADRTMVLPYGRIEDVLVKIDNAEFPVDFIICDMEEDDEVPLILGRPFLKTAKAMIDVDKGKLILKGKYGEVVIGVTPNSDFADERKEKVLGRKEIRPTEEKCVWKRVVASITTKPRKKKKKRRESCVEKSPSESDEEEGGYVETSNILGSRNYKGHHDHNRLNLL